LDSFIDHWHVFQVCNIITLDNKDSTTNLDDITNF
jgi:hypothetical protein